MTQFAEYGWMNKLIPHLEAIYAFSPVICSWPHMALAQSPSVLEGVCRLGLHPEPQNHYTGTTERAVKSRRWGWGGVGEDEEPLPLSQLYIATELHTRNAALLIRCMVFSIVLCGLAVEVLNAVCWVPYSSWAWRLGWEQDSTLAASASEFNDSIW